MRLWNADKQKIEELEFGTFRPFTRDSDLQGILWVLESLQQGATASTHILYSYTEIINRINGLPAHAQLDNSPDPASGR